jgi:hypothetical protein
MGSPIGILELPLFRGKHLKTSIKLNLYMLMHFPQKASLYCFLTVTIGTFSKESRNLASQLIVLNYSDKNKFRFVKLTLFLEIL